MFFESLEESAERDELRARTEDQIRLKPLFEHLQKEYTDAEEKYRLSGLFSSGAREETLAILEGIVNKLNKLYNTKYVLMKEGK